MNLPFPRFCHLALFLIGLSFLSQSVFGQEQQLPAWNCAITPPQGWENVTQQLSIPGLALAYRKPDQSSQFILVVNKQRPVPEIIDDKTVSDFERGLAQNGGTTRTAGKFVEIGGIRGYQRSGETTADERKFSTQSLIISTQEYFYVLDGRRLSGSVGEDADLEKSLASFRFLNSPTAPTASVNPVAAPEPIDLSKKSTAYRIGYFLGKYTLIILPLILLGLGVTIYFVVKRKPRRSRSRGSQPY